MENMENMIDFISGTRTVTCSFTNPKHVRKLKRLHKDHPKEFKYFYENEDGSVCAKLPLKWVKITPPRTMSEEQRRAASERLKKMHEEGKL